MNDYLIQRLKTSQLHGHKESQIETIETYTHTHTQTASLQDTLHLEEPSNVCTEERGGLLLIVLSSKVTQWKKENTLQWKGIRSHPGYGVKEG